MRKRILSMMVLAVMTAAAIAQTMNVQVGNVVTAVPAEQAGDMTYSNNGQTLTVCGKAFNVNDITKIYVDESAVTDNTVDISYNGTTATVTIAGNIAQYITATVNGANVSITQGTGIGSSTGEVEYTLSGTSDNGSFYMDGSYKATVNLNGLTLTNPNGAAIDIQNGKRIAVSIKKGTTNTLTDGSSGSQKGCFVCKGHTEFQGKGTLTVNGNKSHAIWSNEYVEVRNCTINVLSAVKDGINCNQYFTMNSGEINISGIGDDGIQVSLEDDDTSAENTGNFTINDGTVNITVTKGKGIKADGQIIQNGGTLNIIDGSSSGNTTSTLTGNNVAVTWDGNSANVDIANDISSLVTATVNGGHVRLIQSDSATNEITYTLSGSSTNGSLYMDGNLKATFVLNGLNLTNPDSAAINIRDGKRIAVVLADGTTNTLTDGSNGSQKGCMAVKGHTEFSGGGTLNITGKTAHAFWGKEYVQLKASTGTINILGAVGDGFNVNQFYEQKGGTVTVKNVGDDGIQVSYKTDDNDAIIALTEDEDNTGEVNIKGGSIDIAATGKAAKAIKSEGTVTVDDGTLTLKASGAIDTSDASDPSYTACIKAEKFVQNGGSITMTVTGTAGRGVTATDIVTNGGTLDINNSGAGQTGTNDTYTAKGLKADKSMALNGGTINIAMSGTGGKGIKCDSTYTQGLSDGTGPTLTVSTTGSSLGSSSNGGGGGGRPGGGGWGPGGGQSSNGSSAKAIKILGAATLYGGETTVTTKTDGAEGLESKTSIDIQGGKHYFACYDDCINSSGKIMFNGGVTVCYSNGNDAVDSNYGRTGAITIGNGVVFAYTTRGAPEEGLDCDNNSYIQITGTGIAISAGGAQGGGNSSSTISNAAQGYALLTSTVRYTAGNYYTLANSSGKNLVTYSFPAAINSTLSLITATGMAKNNSYTIKSSTSAPTDATTVFHGLYLGSSASGTTNVTSFTAK